MYTARARVKTKFYHNTTVGVKFIFFLNLNFVQKFEIVFKLVLLSQHVQSLCLESAAECNKIAHRLPVTVSTAASDV